MMPYYHIPLESSRNLPLMMIARGFPQPDQKVMYLKRFPLLARLPLPQRPRLAQRRLPPERNEKGETCASWSLAPSGFPQPAEI